MFAVGFTAQNMRVWDVRDHVSVLQTMHSILIPEYQQKPRRNGWKQH